MHVLDWCSSYTPDRQREGTEEKGTKNRYHYQTIIIHSHLFSKLSKAKRSFDNYKLLHNTLKTQMRLQPQLILSPWMVTGCERTHLTHMHMKAKSAHWNEPLIELQGCLPGWQCALPYICEWKSLVVIWFSRHKESKIFLHFLFFFLFPGCLG